ncbi:acyl carrier protein [Streptomyces cinnamoneus]|uniref:Acyl carrier protein n=1 Tax=Streptomyces cinnamoneus TaxID=53446 RepID=A0A2G1XNG4_STRCJ|nr:phosphopantetheine-binding protein [Streptomyces cinnamoneus]PHQ52792.1 acyl carrier protein [Streptomyces cinnamoneus]PPT11894.1 acyl carrier protein [Streptomyces cinnamoneus]
MTEPTTVDEAGVLAEITDVLRRVLDDLELEDIPVTPDTRFVEDLDLESIDLVTLTAELRARYGERVDFPAFFASLELSEIIGLTVGRLVRHIVGSLR